MNRFKKACFACMWMLCLMAEMPLYAQDTTINTKIDYYQKKIKKYLDKENALTSFYSINKEGIKIFASANDKSAGRYEFTVPWKEVETFKKDLKSYRLAEQMNKYSGHYDESVVICMEAVNEEESKNPNGLFYGYRIAIDAGHTAGTIEEGVVEQKFLKFNPNPNVGLKDSIQLAEGMLTYATAALLKEKLEQEGALVFLTRPFNGSTAYGVTFDDWLKSNYKSRIQSLYPNSPERRNWFLTKATKKDKFKLIFKDMELQKRAELINDYRPDFTVIIHYNVDETNTGWTKPGTKNFSMAFIGGAFMRNDLSSREKRFEFLRMIVSTDIELSLALSESVVKSLENNLNVKAASTGDATYLSKGCLYAGRKGVFCRNLQLTRYIHGPLVYGETLYQDNLSECLLLNLESDKLKNVRVQQAAEAYFKGIKEYVENWKK